MTTLLRRSSHLARVSKLSRDTSSLYSSFTTTSCAPQLSNGGIRKYATSKPDDPKDSKNSQNAVGNAKAGRGAAKSKLRGKPARGFEKLYDNAGPMSPHPLQSSMLSDNDQGKAPRGFEKFYDNAGPMSGAEGKKPGFSKLTKQEEEILDRVLNTIRKGLPESEANRIAKAFGNMRQKGMPSEIREIIDKLQGGASMDLATAAKLVRLTLKLARQMAEETIAEEYKDSDENTNSGTGRQGSSSSGGNKKKSSSGGGSPMKGFAGSMDTSTLITGAFVGYLLYSTVMPGENSKEITWQEFKTTFLDKGLVDKLTVLDKHRVKLDLHREATGRMYPESPAQHQGFSYYFTIGSVEAFERKLDDAQQELGIPSSECIPVQYKNATVWRGVFISLLPTILFFAGLYYITRRAGGGGGSGGIFGGMGKSKAKKFNQETDVGVRFKDVAGMDEAKQEIMEFVSFLKEPGQYQRLGAKIPRGALLSGPPGTGKTMLAKATAGEAGVPFFSISGSEFVEIFVGVGASRVRDLFQTARKSTPCIIFIDEIDAVGKSRAKGQGFGGNDEREGTLNQILTEMDGFNTSEQVVVLAGTNRADVLDKALLRPGRFDRHIAIDRPTMEGRKQIFAVHLGKVVTNEEMDHLTGRLAALTPGFSGADIANCVNEAALIGMPFSLFPPSSSPLRISKY